MTSPAAIRPPTSLTRLMVRYILGFTVGIAVGLAPFLGRVKMPLFSPMLELYPVQMQQSLIILSGFLLGIVAVAVQYYATKTSPAELLDRYFGSLLKQMLAVLLLLVVVYKTSVVLVPIERQVSAVPRQVETHYYSLLVGWFRTNSAGCCPPAIPPLECIERHSLDPRNVEACWKYLWFFELALTIPYLFLLGGFGTLVGLLLLKEEEGRRLKRLPAPEPGAAPGAARPKARPRSKAKAGAGTKPEPSPGAKGKPAGPGGTSEPVRNPRPKPSPGSEKRPGTRRRRPPSPPEEPPEG